MNEFYKQALAKLDAKTDKLGNKENAVKEAVKQALKDFCSQNDEFAQAIAQGKPFSDCLKKIMSGVGSSISDIEVYKRAVQFYFPGADVHVKMTLDLGDGGYSNKSESKSIGLSLDSLLDF